MICTGDVVAYGADASKTVALVRNSVRHIIKGNCEESLANNSEDCGCGFPEDSDCSRLSDAWFRHARQQLSDADRLWMAGLPERLVLDIDGVRLAVVHGTPSTINRFVFASTGHALKLKEIENAGVHGVIGGHCGLPFTQSISGYLWHNSGAIGMPANDGTPRVWYGIISRVPDGIAIEHRSIVYDHVATAGKMRHAGLPEGYAGALSTGFWPSCDVLPMEEVQARGRSLVPGTVVWELPTNQRAVSSRMRSPKVTPLWPQQSSAPKLDQQKFRLPEVTAKGEQRAAVDFDESEDAVVQYRNALQYRLPKLLYRTPVPGRINSPISPPGTSRSFSTKSSGAISALVKSASPAVSRS